MTKKIPAAKKTPTADPRGKLEAMGTGMAITLGGLGVAVVVVLTVLSYIFG